jgi:archaellum component FlaC
MQDESTLASLASDSVSKAQKDLDAQALHVTNYSATVDEMRASISRTDSYTKQRIDQLEATVLRQATTISTLTNSNEALSTVNTNLLERFAKLETAVNDHQAQLTTLSAVPAGASALEVKLKTLPDPNGQKSVSTSADPAIADTLKQHATQLTDHASQLEELSGVKSSVDTATDGHMEYDSRIDTLEVEVEKMFTLQKQVEKQIRNIQRSLKKQESVPAQVEDLQERINAFAMDIGPHMENLEQLKHVPADLRNLHEDLTNVINEIIPEACRTYNSNIEELQSDIKKHGEWLKEDSDMLAEHKQSLKHDYEDIKSLGHRVTGCETRLDILAPQGSDTGGGNAGDRRGDDSHDEAKRDEDMHDRDADDEGDYKHEGDQGGDASGIKVTSSDEQVSVEGAPSPEGLRAALSTPIVNTKGHIAASTSPAKEAAAPAPSAGGLQAPVAPLKFQFTPLEGGMVLQISQEPFDKNAFMHKHFTFEPPPSADVDSAIRSRKTSKPSFGLTTPSPATPGRLPGPSFMAAIPMQGHATASTPLSDATSVASDPAEFQRLQEESNWDPYEDRSAGEVEKATASTNQNPFGSDQDALYHEQDDMEVDPANPMREKSEEEVIDLMLTLGEERSQSDDEAETGGGQATQDAQKAEVESDVDASGEDDDSIYGTNYPEYVEQPLAEQMVVDDDVQL